LPINIKIISFFSFIFIIRGGGQISSEHEYSSYSNCSFVNTQLFNGLGQYSLVSGCTWCGTVAGRAHTRWGTGVIYTTVINGNQSFWLYGASKYLYNRVHNHPAQFLGGGNNGPGSIINFNYVKLIDYQVFGGAQSTIFSGNTITNQYGTQVWFGGRNNILIDNVCSNTPSVLEVNLICIRTPILIQSNTYQMIYCDNTTDTLTYPTNIIYGSLLNVDDYSTIAKLKNNNIILYNTGSVEKTGVTYSGASSLRLRQYTSGYEATIGTIEFEVNANTTYNLSYWVKSSNNQNISFNFLNFGQYVNTTWVTGTTSSSTWTNITYTIPQVLVKSTMKLFIRFNSGTGHYVYVSNIQIT